MKPEVKEEIAKVVAEVLLEQKATIEKIVEVYLSKKQPQPKAETVEEEMLPSEIEDKFPLYNSYINKNKPDKKILFRLNLDLYENLKEKAKEREISEASLIRESLMYRILRNSMKNNGELGALFDDCSVWIHGRGKILQFEGEKGLINQAKEREIVGDLWTPEALDKLIPPLWYSLQHSRDSEKLFELAKALRLNREQIQFLIISFRHRSPYANRFRRERPQVMPYAMCQNCNRLLSKKDFNDSAVCKYCGHKEANTFNYENVSDEARIVPYAQCANEECRRPFSEQQYKSWNMCPFCGSQESTVIKYDEVFWSQFDLKAEKQNNKETISEEQNREQEQEIDQKEL